eukprot:TRINITY_DN6987_c0_g1_i1.p1 TRINITY_DN6987_c0_g1~~TRINITY_DN6987_c0_g1_i1.p1  ORF type:complete len:468 (+),score=76.76 TRINITY_DN6987_c0_g1_i1:43-1446(+)
MCKAITQFEGCCEDISCYFCCQSTGLMKKYEFRNKKNKKFVWAHIQCILWIPEIDVSQSFKKNGVIKCFNGMYDNLQSRKILKCNICNNWKGFCLQCSHNKSDNCNFSFHVTCARKNGLILPFWLMQAVLDWPNHGVACGEHLKNVLQNKKYILKQLSQKYQKYPYFDSSLTYEIQQVLQLSDLLAEEVNSGSSVSRFNSKGTQSSKRLESEEIIKSLYISIDDEDEESKGVNSEQIVNPFIAKLEEKDIILEDEIQIKKEIVQESLIGFFPQTKSQSKKPNTQKTKKQQQQSKTKSNQKIRKTKQKPLTRRSKRINHVRTESQEIEQEQQELNNFTQQKPHTLRYSLDHILKLNYIDDESESDIILGQQQDQVIAEGEEQSTDQDELMADIVLRSELNNKILDGQELLIETIKDDQTKPKKAHRIIDIDQYSADLKEDDKIKIKNIINIEANLREMPMNIQIDEKQ